MRAPQRHMTRVERRWASACRGSSRVRAAGWCALSRRRSGAACSGCAHAACDRVVGRRRQQEVFRGGDLRRRWEGEQAFNASSRPLL
eukprot:3306794-Pleurochrysis_carterae.AAC.1